MWLPIGRQSIVTLVLSCPVSDILQVLRFGSSVSIRRWTYVRRFPERATPSLFHPNFRGVPLGLDVVTPRSEDPKLIIRISILILLCSVLQQIQIISYVVCLQRNQSFEPRMAFSVQRIGCVITGRSKPSRTHQVNFLVQQASWFIVGYVSKIWTFSAFLAKLHDRFDMWWNLLVSGHNLRRKSRVHSRFAQSCNCW